MRPCAPRFAGARPALAAWLLAAPALAQGPLPDFDGDFVPDPLDNCERVPNGANQDDQADSDADGIGDACECGDADTNGFIDSSDARLIQRCSVGSIPCPALCDVTADGLCNTTDARLIQRFAVRALSKSDLRCAERCEGAGCPDCGDGFCDLVERCGRVLPACEDDCGLCGLGEPCLGFDANCDTLDGLVCEEGVCLRDDGETCFADTHCASGTCAEGLCGARCAGDSDLPLGCECTGGFEPDLKCHSERCEFGLCVRSDCVSAFDPCRSDSDCCGGDFGGPLRCEDHPAGRICL